MDFEQYVVFRSETTVSLILAGIAVAIVILLATFNGKATLIVLVCVFIVLMDVSAVIHYWNLTFNSIVVVNLMVAIAFAVDYSAHIVNTYLTAEAP